MRIIAESVPTLYFGLRKHADGKGRVYRMPLYSGLTKPVRRCLALAQRERFSKVLKHQVNRFRTICTVCGFVALS